MTAEGLGAVAGIVLSLSFSYIPGLREKYASLNTDYQRLIMLGSLVLAAAIMIGLGCIGWDMTVTCDVAGIRGLGEALFWAVVANQTTYQISPKAKSVRAAKAAKADG